MGKSHSKETFSQWDLDRFSNVIGIPRATIEKLHQEFITTTNKDNRMDKNEFRRLYKELFVSGQTGTSIPAVISEQDLDKISDRVFKAFNADGSGTLSFEDFVNAYLMIGRSQANKSITSHDRLSYILDHNNPTKGYITREHGEEVLNYLNRYYTSDDKTKNTTNASVGGTEPVAITWQQHWAKLDDGSGRVPQEKFIEYITTTDDYKRYLDHPSSQIKTPISMTK